MKQHSWACPLCKHINDIGQYTCVCNYYRGADKLRAEPGISRDGMPMEDSKIEGEKT